MAPNKDSIFFVNQIGNAIGTNLFCSGIFLDQLTLVPLNMYFLLIVLGQCFFCGSFLLFMFHVCLCYLVLSVPCSLVVTSWERADLLAFLCVMCSCVFVTFPYDVPGQVWYLIVSIPDLCLLVYFKCLSWVFEGNNLKYVKDRQI